MAKEEEEGHVERLGMHLWITCTQLLKIWIKEEKLKNGLDMRNVLMNGVNQ